MSSPRPPLRRVVVVGNSLSVLALGRTGTPGEHTWPRLLEHRLRDAGGEVVVENDARMYDLLPEGSRRYRRSGFARYPEVLVIQYGTVEMQPNVVPTPLSRHLTRNVPAQRGLEGRWYRHVVSRVWPLAREWQRWAAPRVGLRSWRVTPHRFRAELRRLIEVGRAGGSQVVVFDIHRPGPTYRHFFPGIDERWSVLQAALHDAVAGFADDTGVTVFAASEISDRFGEEHVPDGMHWTPVVHQAVADELAEVILPVLGDRATP